MLFLRKTVGSVLDKSPHSIRRGKILNLIVNIVISYNIRYFLPPKGTYPKAEPNFFLKVDMGKTSIALFSTFSHFQRYFL